MTKHGNVRPELTQRRDACIPTLIKYIQQNAGFTRASRTACTESICSKLSCSASALRAWINYRRVPREIYLDEIEAFLAPAPEEQARPEEPSSSDITILAGDGIVCAALLRGTPSELIVARRSPHAEHREEMAECVLRLAAGIARSSTDIAITGVTDETDIAVHVTPDLFEAPSASEHNSSPPSWAHRHLHRVRSPIHRRNRQALPLRSGFLKRFWPKFNASEVAQRVAARDQVAVEELLATCDAKRGTAWN